MDYAFDYYQYDYCITLYLNYQYGHAKCLFNRQRNYPSLFSSREAACIAYNKTKTKILAWGDKALELKEGETCGDTIYKDNFIEELQRVYPKYTKDPNDKDALEVLQSVTDFILNLVGSLKGKWTETVGKENTNDVNLHFVFIVPTEWDCKIREDLLRPIFIRTGLISKNDHVNRLLFFTKLESVIQLIQHPKFDIPEKIKVSTQYIMCSVSQMENGLTIKLDAFEFEHCSVGFSTTSTLLPRVSKSVTLNIDFEKVKSGLKDLVSMKIGSRNNVFSNENIESVIKQILHWEVEESKRGLFDKNRYPFKKLDQNVWHKLTVEQTEIIKSITLAEVHKTLLASLIEDLRAGIQDVLLCNFIKIRSLIAVKEAIYESHTLFTSFFKWTLSVISEAGHSFNYNVLIFSDGRPFLKLRSANIIEGAGRKMLETIKISDTVIPPNVIRRDTLENSTVPTSPEGKDPDIIVTVDISFKQVLYSSVLMDGCNVKEIIHSSFPLSLLPLQSFFPTQNRNVLTTLKFNKRIATFLEVHLDVALRYFSKYDRQIKKIKGRKFTARHKIKNYAKIAYQKAQIGKSELCKRILRKENIYETNELFSHISQAKLKEKMKLLLTEYDQSNRLQTQQPKLIKTFLVMYFGYLNLLIKEQLTEHTDYKNKDIGYIISIEKRLLRNIVGTEKKIKELLIASDLFQNEVKSKRLRIISQGEGLLPALQRELNLNLPLKSYFVIPQLHSNYIQATLYQVVQTIETGDEASAIIIQNKIIPLESIYDSLCKHLWSHTEFDENLIQCCDEHKDKFWISKNYKSFTTKVKPYIFRKFSIDSLSMNSVDEKEIIRLDKECKCRIDLSIRDILEVAVKPTIRDIINIVSSTLVNGDLFGKYDVEYLFVLGNLFELSYDSPLHKYMTSLIQEELDNNTEYKELGADSFALLRPFDQLLQPDIGNRHPLHEVFHKGCLHQVSRENYGLDFRNQRTQKGITVSYKDGFMENTVETYHVSVFLRRGQLIPSEGLSRTFIINSKHLRHGENIQIRLLRFSHLKEINSDDIVSLSSVSCDVVQKFFLKKSGIGSTAHVVVNMRPKNHFSSISFTANMVGEESSSKTTGTFVYVGEQLTVAYF